MDWRIWLYLWKLEYGPTDKWSDRLTEFINPFKLCWKVLKYPNRSQNGWLPGLVNIGSHRSILQHISLLGKTPQRKALFILAESPGIFPLFPRIPLFLVLRSLTLFTWFFFYICIRTHDLTFLKDSYIFSPSDLCVSSYSMLKISKRTCKIKDMFSGKKALIVCVVKLSVTDSRR